MKIIVFSDLHYFAGDIETAIFNTKRKLVSYALPMLDKLTEKINSEDASTIAVCLGDLIQDTTEHDGDIEALKFISERLKAIKRPFYTLLGNHDLKMMNSVGEVEEIIGRKTTFSIDAGGWHLVFLTTEVRCELGTERGGCYKAQYLSDEHITWLREDLEKTCLPSIIFTHYALAEDESINDECMFMKNRVDVKKIIKDSGKVKAVVSGHQHLTKYISEDGIDYYLVGSPIADLEYKGEPDGAYAEIELIGEDLKLTNKRIACDELGI